MVAGVGERPGALELGRGRDLGVAQRAERPFAVFADGLATLGRGEPVTRHLELEPGCLLLGRRGLDAFEHLLQPHPLHDRVESRGGRWTGGVVGGRVSGEPAGMGRSEVGAIAGEDLGPLVTRIRHVGGDQVGDVVLASAGHGDVGRRRTRPLTHQDVRAGGGVALRAVDGSRVHELDMLTHIPVRQPPALAHPVGGR